MARRLCFLLVIGLTAGLIPFSYAQPSTVTSSAQARRDELAKVGEMMADPDRLMRLAYLEEIVESGDANRIDIAVKIAVSSDDPQLRGVAMRAYFASQKQIAFDVKLPPQVQKKYDAADEDKKKIDELIVQYPYIQFVRAAGFKIRLQFKEFDFKKGQGVMSGGWDVADFTISGDKLSVRILTVNRSWCELELRPSKALMLEGPLICQLGYETPKLQISAPLF